jgi:hypothetical protein
MNHFRVIALGTAAIVLLPMAGYLAYTAFDAVYDALYALNGHAYADCGGRVECPPGTEPDYRKPPLASMSAFLLTGMGFVGVVVWFPSALRLAMEQDRAIARARADLERARATSR